MEIPWNPPREKREGGDCEVKMKMRRMILRV
jgi:hypothetical protein